MAYSQLAMRTTKVLGRNEVLNAVPVKRTVPTAYSSLDCIVSAPQRRSKSKSDRVARNPTDLFYHNRPTEFSWKSSRVGATPPTMPSTKAPCQPEKPESSQRATWSPGLNPSVESHPRKDFAT